MTKARAPLTFERALVRIADELGWPQVADIAGKDERTVRNWSDPDTSANMTIDVALRLDVAFRAAGGEGSPLFQVYALRLEADTCVACADSQRLAELTAVSAKEGGEAIAALVVAAQPGATPQQRARAELEAEEAIRALTETLAQVRAGARAPDGAIPGGGEQVK